MIKPTSTTAIKETSPQRFARCRYTIITVHYAFVACLKHHSLSAFPSWNDNMLKCKPGCQDRETNQPSFAHHTRPTALRSGVLESLRILLCKSFMICYLLEKTHNLRDNLWKITNIFMHYLEVLLHRQAIRQAREVIGNSSSGSVRVLCWCGRKICLIHVNLCAPYKTALQSGSRSGFYPGFYPRSEQAPSACDWTNPGQCKGLVWCVSVYVSE